MRGLDVGSNTPFPGGVNLQPRVQCSNPVIRKVRVPGPASASPGNLLERQILGLQPRLTESEPCVFKSLPGDPDAF